MTGADASQPPLLSR